MKFVTAAILMYTVV